MPEFQYGGFDNAGRSISGVLQAADVNGLRSALRSEGKYVVRVTERRSRYGNTTEAIRRRLPVKLYDLVVFSQQLSTMVGAGIDLVEAFAILCEQTENERLRRVLQGISTELQTGGSLTSAMSRYPHVFPRIYTSLVRAGEVGGILEETLLKAAENLERELELREKVKTAFAYPIVVMTVAVGVIAAMLIFVVPVFAKVYRQFRAELPAITQLLIIISDLVVTYWWMALIAIAVSIWLFRRFAGSNRGRQILDQAKLRLPLLGKLNQKIVIVRMMEALSALIGAGVPLLEALETSGRVAANWEFEQSINGVTNRVKEGAKLSDELRSTRRFPEMVARMLEVGEESGSLDIMMSRIKTFYAREIEFTVRRLLTLLEPALTVVLGVIVGFILLALYLPVFTLATVIK